ncbi:MAG: RNA polymerase sigma factor [Rhodospirillales bacterium]
MTETLYREIEALLPALRRQALRLTRNRDNADDLVQSCVERALRALDQFQPGTSLKAWLFRILRNTHINDLRRQARWQGCLDIDEHDHLCSIAASQEVCLEFRELTTALTKMNRLDRDVLILVGGEGLTYREAAEELGTAVGTIRSRLSRARVRLASDLAEQAA